MTTINNSFDNTLQPNFYVGATSVTSTGVQLNYLNTSTGLTGTGSVVLNTSPSFVTPILGTPTSGNLINCTALPLGTGISGILSGINGGTGIANTGLTITLSGGSSGYVMTSDISGNGTWQSLNLSGAVLLSPIGDQTISTGSLTLTHGSYNADAGGFFSGLPSGGFTGEFIAYPINASSGTLSFIASNNSGSFKNTLTNSSTTAGQTWSLPDATGTIALTSDLPSSGTPLAASNGGTGISNSFNLTITAASTINQDVSTGATPDFVSISTAPAASGSSSLALGTAYQNTLGYDIVLTVYLRTGSASGPIELGVGPTSTPTQQIIIPSAYISGVLQVIPITIYLPNNYYALLTGGTNPPILIGQQGMPV
jgi:hypothetical protein